MIDLPSKIANLALCMPAFSLFPSVFEVAVFVRVIRPQKCMEDDY